MPEITVPFTGWYESHRKFQVTFTPGLTTLVGKNGSGKSSMIMEMKTWLFDKDIPAYHYDQVREGTNTFHAGLFGGDIATAATYKCSSEGEKIVVSYGSKLQNIKQFLNKFKDSEAVFLLCDGLDSGLSINVIRELLDIFEIMLKEYPNLYIVNTTNNYEFIGNSRCIIAKNGKDIKFKTYNAFVKFITKKDRAKNKEEG